MFNWLQDITQKEQLSEIVDQIPAVGNTSSWWRLRDLVASMTIGVAILTAKKEIVLVNPAMEKILAASTLTIPDLAKYFPIGIEAAIDSVVSRDKQNHFSEIHIGKKVLELTINPTHDEIGRVNGAALIVNDMTYRRLFEVALRHEIDKAQRYLDVAAVLMLVLDPQGKVTLVNKKGCAILDFLFEDIIGKSWFDAFTPQHLQASLKTDFLRMMKGEVKTQTYGEYPIIRKNGQQRLIAWHTTVLADDTGVITGMLYSGEDITERRKAEIKLREEHDRANAIITSMGEGLLVIDKDNIITSVNRTAEKLLGKSIVEIIGKPIETILGMSKGDVPLTIDSWPMMQTLKQGQDSVIELKDNIFFKLPSGKSIPVTIATTPLGGDGITGVVVVFRDASREKEIDRMKTEFISLASHQLRTPLSAMKWFSEMLLDGDAGPLAAAQREFVENINTSNERMIELVNSLLNISRIESGRLIIEPKLTDLKELLTELLSELTPRIQEKKLHLVVSVHHDLPKFLIDPKLIRHVYLNLLTNAIRYTPNGGEIFVFVSKKDNFVISQVTDTGFGIMQKDFPHIFQKFYRGENIIKHVPDGTGLGLYLTRTIVESSGGKIWFSSQEGKGTTFWFSLPLNHPVAKEGEVYLDA